MGVQLDAFAGLLSHKHKASESKVLDLTGYFTGEDVEAVLAEIGAVLATITNPLLFKGSIAVAADFPTSAAVQVGWFYKVTANVTDNDATKTNTGAAFQAGDEIAWDGSAWIEIGNSTLPWGSLTGTLSDQTDLQTALDGKSDVGHTHAASDVVSGTFEDARIAESNVTQHEAALTITESQISDLDKSLAAVLATGNTTGANDIEVSSGQKVKSEAGTTLNLKSYASGAATPPDDGDAGVVAYYPCDEGSGSTLTDTVGGNNASISGATFVGSGAFGYVGDDALAFGGSDSAVSGSNIGISGSSSRTVYVWFSTNTTATQYLVSWGNPAGTLTEFSIGFNGSSQVLVAMNGGNRIWNLPTYADGQFHFLAIVLDGTTSGDLAAYLDGSALTVASTNNKTFNTTNTPLYIGTKAGGTAPFTGNLDNIVIYNDARTSGEIAADHAATQAAMGTYHVIDTEEVVGAGSKLVSIKSGGSEKAYVDEDGDYHGGLQATRYVTFPIETITASSDTLDATNHTVLCDATSNAITINLPSAVLFEGAIFRIKKIDSSSNYVTIDGDGSETIDGATTLVITTQYNSVTIQSDGSNWNIL